ncbi:hypothetical protein B9Z55_022907 [Caenorhabditis nigoni]|uniref:histone acetyltransferase n=1 Tax=Caenorhabditis nigoni TaxID=1611254 RepID=A0A2G5SME4_9PELO|nr:hypothetical protein B9Z55_022907 [Caenorhabditis nigoni]
MLFQEAKLKPKDTSVRFKKTPEVVFVIQILDSVPNVFERNRKQGVNRTFLYYQLLLSYFDYMRSVGILNDHFQSDPPLKGDDVHPERLKRWYRTMMDQGKAEGIIQEYKDFKKRI